MDFFPPKKEAFLNRRTAPTFISVSDPEMWNMSYVPQRWTSSGQTLYLHLLVFQNAQLVLGRYTKIS
jgi:hypothetical protein